MPQELLFELDDVRVTPYIAQFAGTSYQIGSISSVRARKGKKLSRVAIFVFLLGVSLFVAAILRSPRRIFTLVLRTQGGDVEVLTSSRSRLILDVKQAIEAAFVAHAERSSPQRST